MFCLQKTKKQKQESPQKNKAFFLTFESPTKSAHWEYITFHCLSQPAVEFHHNKRAKKISRQDRF
ncbi:hypothetical protein AGMMS49990_02650 [Endomicrobiia bacterium]|nr:hypothetical protein AGMMS49990_02650 [Endomicrobiia bacterium]